MVSIVAATLLLIISCNNQEGSNEIIIE